MVKNKYLIIAKCIKHSRKIRPRGCAPDITWLPLESIWIARIPSLNNPRTVRLEVSPSEHGIRGGENGIICALTGNGVEIQFPGTLVRSFLPFLGHALWRWAS